MSDRATSEFLAGLECRQEQIDIDGRLFVVSELTIAQSMSLFEGSAGESMSNAEFAARVCAGTVLDADSEPIEPDWRKWLELPGRCRVLQSAAMRLNGFGAFLEESKKNSEPTDCST